MTSIAGASALALVAVTLEITFAGSALADQSSTAAFPSTAAPAEAPPASPPTASQPAPYAAAPYTAPPPTYAPYPPPGYYYPPPTPPVTAPVPPVPANAPRVRSVSAVFSPVHLLLPVFQAEVEVRPVDKLGITLLGGIGSVTPSGWSTSFAVQEVGGKVAYYPLHAFDSLTLGAELLYVHLSGNGDQSVAGVAGGVLVGPFVGYKWIADVGFTFAAQLGVGHLSASADASAQGVRQHVDESQWLPILDLNVGWSF